MNLDPPIDRARARRYAVTAVLVLLVGILYRDTFAWLVHIWWNDKEYSHGFLVPIVSLYLVWRKRELLASQALKPSTVAGGAVLLSAGLMFLAGRSGGVVLAEAVSFLFLLVGLVLFLRGWGGLKAIALPLAYLQFMVPWGDDFIDKIHVPFQLLSAWLGWLLIRTTGIPALLDAEFIALPNVVLEVARECSGVRFLTSVVALGLPLTYLTQTKWGRAVGVLAAGVVITIAVNGLRIALAGNMAYRYGTSLLHGPFHIFQGWFVAQVGFLALVLVNWLVMRRAGPDAPVLCDRWRISFAAGAPRGEQATPGWGRGVALIVATGVVIALSRGYVDPVSVPRDAGGRPLPQTFGGWKGKDLAWIRGSEFFPGADDEVARKYSNGDGPEIYYYSGYFGVQKQGKSIVNFHANPITRAATPFDSGLSSGPRRVESAEVVINGVRYRVYYWYRLRSRYLSGRYAMKVLSVVEALVHRRNDATVYLVALPATRKDGVTDWAAAKKFVENASEVLDGSTM